MSPDPIGFAGGLNLYAYCGGDPVGLVDPSGLLPIIGKREDGTKILVGPHPPRGPGGPTRAGIYDVLDAIGKGWRALQQLSITNYGCGSLGVPGTYDPETPATKAVIATEALGWDIVKTYRFGEGGLVQANTVTVGRWMSEAEYEIMKNTGRIVESRTGTTHVAYPADPEAFRKQAPAGSVYVEYDVPQESLRKTGEGWAKIVGPNTLEGRLAARKGLPVPELPIPQLIRLIMRK